MPEARSGAAPGGRVGLLRSGPELGESRSRYGAARGKTPARLGCARQGAGLRRGARARRAGADGRKMASTVRDPDRPAVDDVIRATPYRAAVASCPRRATAAASTWLLPRPALAAPRPAWLLGNAVESSNRVGCGVALAGVLLRVAVRVPRNRPSALRPRLRHA